MRTKTTVKGRRTKRDAAGALVYQLKITLLWSEPPIWRRVLMPATSTLGALHYAIQDVMGWTNSHLHEFAIGDERYTLRMTPRDDVDASSKDANGISLQQALTPGVERFVYIYDFGDSWEHLIEVEALLPAAAGQRCPACTAGARNCPPDDCGGMPGYEHFLEAYTNAKHPDHEDMREWAGDGFDPEHFDLKETNECLRHERTRTLTEAQAALLKRGR